MEKKDKLFMSIYNDYYSELLTEYQSMIISKYYDEDLSLAEIADQLNISPQGVRDTLKRTEKILIDMEEKLGLVKKSENIKGLLKEIYPQVDDQIKAKIDDAIKLLNE